VRFDEMVAYYAEHGRLPPQRAQGLGRWVTKQRAKRETMDAERKARLDALPWWVWDPYDAAWSANFDELLTYHAEHGGIPPRSAPGGLGKWARVQRECHATMAAERKEKLDSLEWWVWDPLDQAWSAKFDELVAYGKLPAFSTPGGIWNWVDRQRRARATMAPERKARLDALGWWVWDARHVPIPLVQ
jgi:hypothetical protein